jgi:hypothetical protein
MINAQCLALIQAPQPDVDSILFPEVEAASEEAEAEEAAAEEEEAGEAATTAASKQYWQVTPLCPILHAPHTTCRRWRNCW